MTKLLIELPENTMQKLDYIAHENQISRVHIIREAINEWIESHNSIPSDDDVFGILKSKRVDGIKLQRKLRKEWR
jgi:metal-responsive CopG/Arc/MetJ family transcriptional regulator